MEASPKKTLLMDETALNEAVEIIADLILDEFDQAALRQLAFVGIQQRGVELAQRLISCIRCKADEEPEFGTLDISLYRDDIGRRKTLPTIHETRIPFAVDEKTIILVDDVLQSGRTIRAALDAITDYGRPEYIRLAVLLDRGGREFPIQADYIGRSVDVTPNDVIRVLFSGVDGEDMVFICER